MDTGIVMNYCERLGPGLLAEPLNALSNGGFFLGAWSLYRGRGTVGSAMLPPVDRGRLALLSLLMALVGAASLCFHTTARPWAGLLDVAFIGLFNVYYLVIFLRVVPRWPVVPALLAGAAFVLMNQGVSALLPRGAANGSLLYLPSLAVLLLLVVSARRIAPPAGRIMTQALAVFLLSLSARTMDRDWCSAWPWGTHFVWHLLNAWVLFQLSRALQAGMAARDARFAGISPHAVGGE